MHGLCERIDETVGYIRSRWSREPRIGIICGTGLGKLIERMEPAETFTFEELPHFVPSTALGHAGKLICGKWHQTDVVALQGRLHFYEGYTLQEITFPVRVLHALGIDLLIITSASGGMHPQHHPGQIIVLDDHINLMGDNPLAGWNDDQLGPRYPDMSSPYDPPLIEKALDLARQQNISADRGVYVGVKGPNYETRAEYRFFRAIGGDVVGMSTVPETLVAIHAGMRVVGLSTVTNVCLPDALTPTSGQEVINVADSASRNVGVLIDGLIRHESKTMRGELFP
ncbi:purine-nucleoside phosphorylase [Rubinisphaera margarita]|uniref:purine-nucleoside phosphorylase n=1 Tax=Rubinisphaera margarita TaxID=2909586 RepID=UPI001EE9413A|nr:purine-nucleoside phosphorylase [Rubinisphaera margarita]MCG6156757.1 purine-nucleoside phosphorylase [Rubinisphaera margarita]